MSKPKTKLNARTEGRQDQESKQRSLIKAGRPVREGAMSRHQQETLGWFILLVSFCFSQLYPRLALNLLCTEDNPELLVFPLLPLECWDHMHHHLLCWRANSGLCAWEASMLPTDHAWCTLGRSLPPSLTRKISLMLWTKGDVLNLCAFPYFPENIWPEQQVLYREER